MAILTVYDEQFPCSVAMKGDDFIRLLDEAGNTVFYADGITDFSPYILDGTWEYPYKGSATIVSCTAALSNSVLTLTPRVPTKIESYATLVFQAPCDCGAVASMSINGDTYSVVDALGEVVTGIGGAWGDGAYVLLAVDPVNKKAYALNSVLGRNAMGFRRTLTSADNMDNVTESGVYVYYTNGLPANAPFTNAAIVEVFGVPDGNKIQRAYRYGDPGYSAFRPLFNGTWDAWSYPQSDTKPTETNLALGSNVTRQRQGRYFKTQDRVVTVSGELIVASGSVADNVTLATLPEGYRPQVECSYPATWWFNGTSNTSATRVPGAIIITTAGVIKGRIISGDIKSGVAGNIFFNASFVAK